LIPSPVENWDTRRPIRPLVGAPSSAIQRIGPQTPLRTRELQFLDERPSFLQVGRVKSLGKLIIGGPQQRQGLHAFVLTLPDAREITGRTQLEAARTLAPGNLQAGDQQGLDFIVA